MFETTQQALEPVTKEFVLSRVSEEDIMAHYLGVEVQFERKFKSPLRVDNTPTCEFSYYNGRLKMRDWSEYKSKDCFDVVQRIKGCSFYDALSHVARDLGLRDKEPHPDLVAKKRQEIAYSKQNTSKKEIKIKSRPFQPIDIAYFGRYGISKEILTKFHCYSVKYVWVGGDLIHISTDRDPCVAYYFGRSEDGHERWKLYFYLRSREKQGSRFMGNTNRINGWNELPKQGNSLVLTKSMKDVMTLDALGVTAIAMQNETTMPYDYVVQAMKARFGKVFSLYDFDRTGITTALKLRREFDIPPLFLGDGTRGTTNYRAKDISDYVGLRGVEAAEILVRFAKHRLGL